MTFNWRTVKRYLPEILTGVAIVGIPVGDYFLIKGVKEENKTKKILGGTIHGVSAVSILASNRLSASEKVGLMAAGAASAVQFSDYRKAVQATVSPEQFEQIEKIFSEDELEGLMIEADEADELIEETVHRKNVYYYPQLRRMIQADPDTVDVALLNLNTSYSLYGRASVADYFRWINPKLIQDLDYNFGWLTYDEDPECGYTQITINQYTKPTRSGQNVTYIWFMDQPLKFEEWEAYYDAMFRDLEEKTNERRYYGEVTSALR